MSLRIPLTPDQTLQTEFHEIERRLRKLEKATGVGINSSRVLIAGSSGTGTVNLQPIYDRLNDLEAAIAGLPDPITTDFGGVGPASVHGLVPAPGTAVPPSGVAGHVLLEDGTWGFPFRGLIQVATSGEQTAPPYDLIDINAALSAQTLVTGDANISNLYTHGDVEYVDAFWDDLRFPAGGFNPAGSTAPPSVNTSTGLLDFSGTADNIIGGVAQMPHGWKVGSAVQPHIHLWFPTSAVANTRWKFEYDIANVNGNFTNNYGTYTTLSTITVANPGNVKKHVIAAFGELSMTGFTLSACIAWRITRLAASDAADNNTSDLALIEFDLHYQTDSPGSSDEYVK